MFESVLRMIALTRKELLAILKDPRSRITLFVPPIIQCLIFGYAATFDLSNVPYAAYDQDRSAASQQLLARLDGSGVFRRIGNIDSPAAMTQAIDNGRALLVLQIAPDFERRLQAGEQADVQVVADGRNSNTAGVAMGYVSTIVATFNGDWRSGHGGATPTVQPTLRAWYNANLETRWNMIPALIGTLTMMQTVMLTALSVAREREQGTFDQLQVTPLRPAEIIVGKTVPSMLVGAVQATNVLLVAQLWFHIPFQGSFLVLYAGLVLFLLAAVGLGLFVSSVAQTMQQAMLYTFIVMMPFMLLSGLTTPISSMPQVLQDFTLINPLRYAIDIAHRVYLEGAGLDRLGPDLLPLAAIGVVALTGASWMFQRRLG
ncbi:MAG: ABC transporter permease [Caulobacteraceae bacterium]|nr:ABC transporter permease [Caulobacteraceae bacterium]